MDTYMDTKIFIVFPLHILQFIIGDDIVSSEDRGRLVTGDWHDGEMVISSEPEIVNRAVTKIVKSEISQSRFRYGFIPLALIVSWEGSDGFTTVEENTIGSDPSWKTSQALLEFSDGEGFVFWNLSYTTPTAISYNMFQSFSNISICDQSPGTDL